MIKKEHKIKLGKIIEKYVINFEGFRKSDIIKEASRFGISKFETTEFLKEYYPYAYNRHYVVKLNKSRLYRPITVSNLGQLQCDIMFFSRKYGPKPKSYFGICVVIDILSRRVYLNILKNNKTATSLIRSLKSIYKRYKKDTRCPIISLSMDNEGATRSYIFKKFIETEQIDFVTFTLSKNKASLVENVIGRIRKLYQQMYAAKFGKIAPLWQCLRELENGINNRKIILDGKNTDWTPASINKSNVQEYITYVNSKIPAKFFANYTVDSDLYKKYKFNIGDRVRIILKAIKNTGPSFKSTQQSLTNMIFIVKRRLLYVAANMTLQIGYIVSKEYIKGDYDKELDLYNSFFVHEKHLVINSQP